MAAPSARRSCAPQPARRRAKDRKQQIIAAARPLFVGDGYRNVSMAQIAAEVDITAGALYRHFATKSELLGAVIDTSLDELSILEVDSETQLTSVVQSACNVVVARRDLGVLWWRESRHLEPASATRLERRLEDINWRFESLVRSAHPGVGSEGAQRLARGLESVLGSTSFHSTRLSHNEFVQLLVSACTALIHSDVHAAVGQTRAASSQLSPASMRERLLMHAAKLFVTQGYDETSLNDIGAAAGVTGPNLYGYFASKAHLLDATYERGTNALWLSLRKVLRDNDDPRAALRQMVIEYTELVRNRTHLVSILISHDRRAERIDDQREYIAEWVALLRAGRRSLNEPRARALVHTALAVIHHLSTWNADPDDRALFGDIAVMATAVLLES